MTRHRSGDTQAIELLPDLWPAALAPDAGFAAAPSAEPATPRNAFAPTPATRRVRRVMYVTAIVAALSALAAGLPVADEMQRAASPATVPPAAAVSVVPSVAPILPGHGGARPLLRHVEIRRDDQNLSRTQPATDSVNIVTSQASFDPLLLRALEALQADRLAAAEADYASVLATEPHNTDALEGMATIALRRGQTAQAEALFRRAVEADPMNAAALAGLLGLQPPERAADAESRLKGLIAAQPGDHRLRFALGNVLAGSDRWHEAQEEYFHAHAGDPQQPDYLFNLAVSLDRLHQHQLAADYYAAALAAAAQRPAQFEQSLASSRLGELAE